MKRAQPNQGFTLVELLVVITIIGILIALLLPAVQSARESARKLQCSNNLKQASLAMLQHEELHKFFPSGGWGWWWVGDPDRGAGKKQPGGWIYSILPFMEQTALLQLGSDNDPENWTTPQLNGSAQRIRTPLSAMNCPTRRATICYPISQSWFGGAVTFYGASSVSSCARADYVACAGDMFDNQYSTGPSTLAEARMWTQNNSWPNIGASATGISFQRSEVKTAMITDGVSNTYMIGEKYLTPDFYFNGNAGSDNETMYVGYDNDVYRTTYCPVPQPSNYAPTHTPMQDRTGYDDNGLRFGSAHAISLNMSFCDGSVQAINYSIQAEVHRRLGNRRDGLTVNPKSL